MLRINRLAYLKSLHLRIYFLKFVSFGLLLVNCSFVHLIFFFKHLKKKRKKSGACGGNFENIEMEG
jgi:hypothetical protein